MLLELELNVEVIQVLDGQCALKESMDRHPAACILDVDMPILSGIEVALALRAGMGSGCPFLVAVSGGAQLRAAASVRRI